jgi:hypothetical protein
MRSQPQIWFRTLENAICSDFRGLLAFYLELHHPRQLTYVELFVAFFSDLAARSTHPLKQTVPCHGSSHALHIYLAQGTCDQLEVETSYLDHPNIYSQRLQGACYLLVQQSRVMPKGQLSHLFRSYNPWETYSIMQSIF